MHDIRRLGRSTLRRESIEPRSTQHACYGPPHPSQRCAPQVFCNNAIVEAKFYAGWTLCVGVKLIGACKSTQMHDLRGNTNAPFFFVGCRETVYIQWSLVDNTENLTIRGNDRKDMGKATVKPRTICLNGTYKFRCPFR